MNLLLFCPSLRSASGGLEGVFSRICKRLYRRQHDVHSIYKGEEFKKIEGAHTTSWDLPLEQLRTWQKLPRPKSTVQCAKDLSRLSKIIGQVQPDIVNCHFASFSASYFCLLKHLHRYRLVISTHGRDLIEGINALQRAVRPYLLRTADHATGVSSALEARIQQETDGRTPTNTIPNGVDVEFWSDGERKRHEGAPIITNVGALRHVKGQDVLLRAFPEVLSAQPDAQLWLVGDGEARRDLESLASRLGVAEHVMFHGWCSHEEVRALLHRSTVFAFPSRNEGFGVALLEAMATGLPAVASRTGGVTDIIQPERQGILVQAGKKEPLARALCRILKSERLRRKMSVQAKRRAEMFEWTQVIDLYEDLFKSLVFTDV